MEQFRNELLLNIKNNFTVEQLHIINDAMLETMQNWEVTKSEHRLSTNVFLHHSVEIDSFLLSKEFYGKSTGTLKLYRTVLNNFYSYINKNVKEATDGDIRGFLREYQKIRGISNRTKDGHRLVINSFYTWMHNKGMISQNQARMVEPIQYISTVRKPLTYLEMEEIRVNCKNEIEHAIIETLYSTGCRVSELININVSDIDFDNCDVKVCGKRNKERFVFLNTKAKFRIQRYLKFRLEHEYENGKTDDDALFVSCRNPHQRLTKAAIESIVKNIGIRANIKDGLYPHRLRHTFASHALDNGMPLDVLQDIMGHEKADTTKIYAKNSKLRMKESFQRSLNH